MSTELTWSSPLSGFLSRAQPHTSPEPFTPARPTLLLCVTRTTRGDPHGFTLALFSSPQNQPDAPHQYYAVNAKGTISLLQPSDATSLINLAHTTLTTRSNAERTWTIHRKISDVPSDRILVPRTTLTTNPAETYSDEFLVARIEGFDYKTRKLREEIDDLQELPDDLWELVGVVLEGRKTGGEEDRNEGVLKYVKDLIWNVYHSREPKPN